MPSLKEIRSRIKSVKSTQQSTKAMKMVSASKMRRAQDAIVRFRPYAAKLNELLNNLAKTVEGEVNSPYLQARDTEKVLLVVVTSNRGLCGAFNNNIIKLVLAAIEGPYAQQYKAGKVELLCIGKKAYEFFQKRGYKMVGENHDVFAGLNFDKVNAVAEIVMDGYVAGRWDKVDLFYNEFKNVATQVRTHLSFLPIEVALGATEDEKADGKSPFTKDYIFEPSREEIIEGLIPQILKVKFYRAVLESNASEHGARMVAMDNATENAQELLRLLRLSYNKARQASITKEILEIVGGAEALNG